jgi:uncharacterized phage-like protein YoqJ
MENNSCCFIGHRTVEATEKMQSFLSQTVEKLITEENVDTFLFGSRSEFNTIALDIVTKIKEKYQHIKRVYVRAEYPYIDDQYTSYLLKSYDETYFPEKIIGAGRAVYVERNYEMINKSKFCVFYYDESLCDPKRKSGTKIALDYAVKNNKTVINCDVK